ncbi:MAG: glycoside hydrolase, partial [Prevotellaceae bacterium]|nr:glycoside hydrolase [Candidatus Faecinaster equi]
KPDIAAKMVVSYLRGLWNSGITGCIKHFPGHGDTKNDTHTGYAASNKTWAEMLDCEMITFKAGIAAGTEMIMTAHIAAPAVTGSDIPSTMSSVILQDKLRGELGYKGIIVTDALEMGAITQKYTPAEAAIETIKAGVDIVLLPMDYKQVVDGIIEAVEKGEISEKRIDESVRRILLLKLKKGLLK